MKFLSLNWIKRVRRQKCMVPDYLRAPLFPSRLPCRKNISVSVASRASLGLGGVSIASLESNGFPVYTVRSTIRRFSMFEGKLISADVMTSTPTVFMLLVLGQPASMVAAQDKHCEIR